MASEMKVDVVHSPTPYHLRNLGLSVFDYPDEVNNNRHCLFAEKLKLLKKLLSEALTRFYPFVGKFEYNVSISCNDHGAAFFRPKLTADLFECGGLVIGVSILHKVTDASTFNTFIKHWTEIAQPLLVIMTRFLQILALQILYPPPQQDFFNSPKPTMHLPKDKCITRRYMFDALSIIALKTKVAGAAVPNPTRVEAVLTLIWKCAMEASRSNLGSIKPSVLCQAVNIRKGLLGQAENLMGNLVWCFTAMNLESIEVYKEKHPNGVSGDVVMQTIKESGNLGRHDVETYAFSSWCRLPFYKANFGWGKSAWVSIRSIKFKNMIALKDMNDGGGIEATLTLKEDDIAMIGSNKEFLAYASLNPAVI
ncbi:BAHD acyltransferase [Pyrus ussuriensis x Pyrus communis]|uniref:BAHD acyltransferase n=1 Tax=Pyrus ussuriensis x Pyrus communis TaxID=2448454 RepID=A0A5N5G4C1_9ROSA|nr:BAHD acyltransferase [Pyrus ussuriensis x Pyrus communis]